MIQVIDLHKNFNGQKVLDGINLTIPTGEIGNLPVIHLLVLMHDDRKALLLR